MPRQIADGGVLYRDFWDVKQPGIYFFYVVGGTLFGYSEVALHLFELAYQLAFAVVLCLTLRGVFRRRWIGPLVALLILGTYYATVEPVELGQVESLVGFPLYLTLWCAVQAVGGVGARSSHRVKHTRVRVRWLIASGLAGGVVLLFKLVLAPVVGGIWLLTAWELARAVPTGRVRAVASTVAAVAVGVFIPIAIATAYLAAHGQLGTVRWTYFTVTSQATAIAGRPISRLTEGGFRTGIRWALPLTLALIAVVAAARAGAGTGCSWGWWPGSCSGCPCSCSSTGGSTRTRCSWSPSASSPATGSRSSRTRGQALRAGAHRRARRWRWCCSSPRDCGSRPTGATSRVTTSR